MFSVGIVQYIVIVHCPAVGSPITWSCAEASTTVTGSWRWRSKRPPRRWPSPAPDHCTPLRRVCWETDGTSDSSFTPLPSAFSLQATSWFSSCCLENPTSGSVSVPAVTVVFPQGGDACSDRRRGPPGGPSWRRVLAGGPGAGFPGVAARQPHLRNQHLQLHPLHEESRARRLVQGSTKSLFTTRTKRSSSFFLFLPSHPVLCFRPARVLMAARSRCWTAPWSTKSSRKLLWPKISPWRRCRSWRTKLSAVLSTWDSCRRFTTTHLFFPNCNATILHHFSKKPSRDFQKRPAKLLSFPFLQETNYFSKLFLADFVWFYLLTVFHLLFSYIIYCTEHLKICPQT